jgi:hemerythrin
MLKWDDKFSVGVEMIDEQHKKLFEIGNRAYQLLNNEIYIDKYNKIVSILHELIDYTEYHFNWEEEYMISIGYKRMFTQKVEHDGFIKELKNINYDRIDRDQNNYIKEILDFLFTWITEHILDKDMLIGRSTYESNK